MLFEKLVEKAYRGNVFMRRDPDGSVFYFSPENFDGLKYEPFKFKSFAGNTLSGYFYYYDQMSHDRVIIFDHGMGAGHRAYMKEIEMLAKHGYTVFSYDHTGCFESEGDDTNGLCQSLADLDACVTALKALPMLNGASFSVMGHSWGAFSTMNIAALHPEITHIVAMAGFVSVKRMVKQSFSGIMRGYAKPMYELESRSNPTHISYDAVETLKNSTVKALLIYSEDDPIVNVNHHYRILEAELKNCDNVTLMLIKNKAHNPNYTESAVKYKDKFFGELTKKKKSGALSTDESKAEFVSSYDWNAMTEQDESIWKTIFKHLDK